MPDDTPADPIQPPPSPASSPAPPSPAMLGGVPVGDATTKRALTIRVWDGLFASMMIALTETFAVAAAVSLKSPAVAIALLGSVPLLAGSLLQLLLPRIVDPGRGRKFFVVKGVWLQSIFLAVCAFSGALPEPWGVSLFLSAFVLYGLAGNSVNMFWIAWMRDLTPACAGAATGSAISATSWKRRGKRTRSIRSRS